MCAKLTRFAVSLTTVVILSSASATQLLAAQPPPRRPAAHPTAKPHPLPILHLCTTKIKSGGARAGIIPILKWKTKTLHVKFLNGEPSIQQHVKDAAVIWSDYAGITFVFDDSDTAEIKIKFANDNQSWSYLGTDAKTQTKTPETMHFGWFNASTTEKEYHRTVIHEFGHALGLVHEHKLPGAAAKIKWDTEKLYAYYAKLGWSKFMVQSQILDTYDESMVNHTKFDPESIMLYAIPKELTKDGYSVGWNTELSTLDKEFIAGEYPK